MPSFVRLLAASCAAVLVVACGSTPDGAGTPTSASDGATADAVMRIVDSVRRESHLRAVIVRVTKDGREILTRAVGDSMTGVPATPAMHFRNGAVAISYVSTLLLRLADQGRIGLDDRLSTWLPDVPHANRVTLRQLAQMTSGYPDYVLGNAAFDDASYANPFRQWTPDELLDFAVSRPLLYEPGTNWNYAHTNYVLLGLALERATGQDMPTLLKEQVLGPLGLTDTIGSFTPDIPVPVLHAFSSERRQALQIPAGTPFYEESTFWNPSWTLTSGAVQTTTVYDMEAGAVGVGTGKLLSKESHDLMVSTALRGKTRAQPGCATCAPMTERYTYGMGVVVSGDWLLQNPMFAGEAGVAAYLPEERIAIAIATTFAPEAFDGDGNYVNGAQALFRRIGAELAPGHAPP